MGIKAQHFIITEFSYRKESYLQMRGSDPLKPALLEHRFMVFQIACLPSILGQVDQDFTWILIIDKDLPEKYRIRLEKLISVRPNSFLYVYNPNEYNNRLNWLEKYICKKTEYVLSTKLDDDDAIFNEHTKYVKDHLNKLLSEKELSPLYFFGSYNAVQWDFFYSIRANLGFRKPRPSINFPVASGLTVCCKYPQMNYSRLNFGHHIFHLLPEDSVHFSEVDLQKQERIKQIRDDVKKSASASNLNWDGILQKHSNFHTIETDFPAVLLMNHFQIAQYTRILSSEWEREPMEPESFPNISINFPLAESYIKNFRFSITPTFKLVYQALKLNKRLTKSLSPIKKTKGTLVLIKNVLRAVKQLK